MRAPPPRAESGARWSATPLASVALMGAAALALVHATLLRTDPAPDATLDRAPTAVHLWFSEGIEAAPDPLVVLDPGGRRIDRDAGVNPGDPTELRATLDAGGAGTYAVRWRVVSDDGHVVEGAYRFDVGGASAPPAAAGGAPSAVTGSESTAPGAGSPELPLLTAGRMVHLIGLTLAVGALALLLLLPKTAAGGGAVQKLARVGDVGSIVLLAAAALMLVAQSAAMQGSAVHGLTHDAIREALHSRWANAWAVRTFAAAALLVVFGLLRRSARPRPGLLGIGTGAALVLLLATSANGHAITTAPVWLSVLDDSLHLAATGAWIGGGVCLAVLAAGWRGEDVSFASVRGIVSRFSMLALACVQVLIVTGLYQAWAHVDRPALLTRTSYGQALLVKLGLFALMSIPAGLNRFAIKPLFLAPEPADAAGRRRLIRRFTRTIGLEALVGAGVLACAALLSALPPAYEEMSMSHEGGMAMSMAAVPHIEASAAPPAEAPALPQASPNTRIFAASSDARSFVLSVDPGALGGNQVTLSVRGTDGRPDTASVALRAVAPEGSGVAPTLIRLSTGSGEHHALLSLGTAGAWSLEVLVGDERAAAFSLDVASP